LPNEGDYDENGFCLLEHQHIRNENGLIVRCVWAHRTGNSLKIDVKIPHDDFRKVFRSTPKLLINGGNYRIKLGEFTTAPNTMPREIYQDRDSYNTTIQLPRNNTIRSLPIDIGDFLLYSSPTTLRELELWQLAAEYNAFGTSTFGGIAAKQSKLKQHYPDLDCACCEKKITHPQNVDQYLGDDETIKYLDACKKLGQKPQIFCCSCLPMIQNNPTIMNHWTAIKNQSSMFGDKLAALEAKEQELIKREKELDSQLSKH